MIERIEIDDLYFLVSCSDCGSVKIPIKLASLQTGRESSPEIRRDMWLFYKKRNFRSRFEQGA